MTKQILYKIPVTGYSNFSNNHKRIVLIIDNEEYSADMWEKGSVFESDCLTLFSPYSTKIFKFLKEHNVDVEIDKRANPIFVRIPTFYLDFNKAKQKK